MNSRHSQIPDLIIAMARSGVLGYGGGPSVIPLIRYEAVTKYKWMNDDEFGEILAIANALPGPIATKMAAYVGYHVKGVSGAVIAVIAHILPTSVAMVALLGFLYSINNSPVISGMIAAVRPVITVMLGIMAYEFFIKGWKGLGKIVGVAFTILAFLLLSVLNIHPGIVVALFLAYGAFHLKLMRRIKMEADERRGVSS